MNKWLKNELAGVSLGDKRLDDRLLEVVEGKCRFPNRSLSRIFPNLGERKGAYRLIANSKVTMEKILESHFQASCKRVSGDHLVLAIQDSSNLNFGSSPAELGYLDHGRGNGLMGHMNLLVSGSGLPLGLCGASVWERQASEKGKTKDRRKVPIEERESYKWLASLQESQQRLAGKKVLHVGDREADVFALFRLAQEHEADLLVRSGQNRKLASENLLFDELDQAPLLGKTKVKVAKGKHRKTSDVTMGYKAIEVEVMPPQNPKRGGESVRLTVVEALELDKKKKEPLRWVLYTTLPVNSKADAERMVKYYSYRWLIERFFYVLKSGTKLQALQFESKERLQTAMAIYIIAAWKIMHLTYLARIEPQTKASEVFREIEWKVLAISALGTTKVPEKPPTVAQAVEWLALLGGKTWKGTPGMLVLWEGYAALNQQIKMAQIFMKGME